MNNFFWLVQSVSKSNSSFSLALVVGALLAISLAGVELFAIKAAGEILKQLTEAPVENKSSGSAFIVLILSAVMLRLFSQVYFNYLGHLVGYGLTKKIIMEFRNNLFKCSSSGELTELALVQVKRIVREFFLPIFIIGMNLLTLAALMVGMYVVDPKVTTVLILVLCSLSAIYLRLTGPLTRRSAYILANSSGTVSQTIDDAFRAMPQVVDVDTEKYLARRVFKADRVWRQAEVVYQVIGQLPRFLVEIGLWLVIFGIMKYGSIISPSDSLALSGVYAYAGFRLLPVVPSIHQNWNLIRGGAVTLTYFREKAAR